MGKKQTIYKVFKLENEVSRLQQKIEWLVSWLKELDSRLKKLEKEAIKEGHIIKLEDVKVNKED